VDLGDRDLGHIPKVHLHVGDLLHRSPHVHQQHPVFVVSALITAFPRSRFASRGQVVTRTKATSGAAQDDDPTGLIRFQVVQAVVEFGKQLAGQSIHFVRTVERNPRQSIVGPQSFRGDGVVVAHGVSLQVGSSGSTAADGDCHAGAA